MSLSVRLFICLIAVAAASTATAWYLSRGGVRSVMETYLVKSATAPSDGAAEALASELADRWSAESGFRAAQALLSEKAASSQHRYLLIDPSGAIAAASEERLLSRAQISVRDGGVSARWSEPSGGERLVGGGIPIRSADGEIRGYLLELPGNRHDEEFRAQEPAGVLGSLDRRLGVAALVAFTLALLVSALVSREISRPIRQLAQATDRLAAGERGLRLPPKRKDELGRLVASFNGLAASLDHSEGLRRQLVADVAHELRTPVTGLQGQIEAMQDGLMTVDGDSLESLHEDIVHLGNLVADLQMLALAEADEIRLECSKLDLLEEARQAVRALGPQEEPGSPATVSGTPVAVWGDRSRLRQILTNLLANAHHHAPGGAVRVEVSQDGEFGVVSVADNGPGIAEADLPHIFERLYRADRNTGTYDGLGLGLAIVKELTRLHQGTVTVRSRTGSGSRFEVRLPTAAANS